MLHEGTRLRDLAAAAPALPVLERTGAVSQVIGLTVEVAGLASFVGEEVVIGGPARARARRAGRSTPRPFGHRRCPEAGPVRGEVVGFRGLRSLVMPYGDASGIAAGGRVLATGGAATIMVGDELLGRVVDGMAAPLDGAAPIHGRAVPLRGGLPAHPLSRLPITMPFHTGVRVIDALLTCGRGQRMGIFAGSGVGKSTCLGAIARHAESDVNVIALIGERGREVQEFIADNLGPDGLARTVLVVATSDQPALLRIRAAWAATAIAEYFRDRGHDVLFMADSITRLAMAQREVGLAIGEPPTTRGYTPSVFALLPRILERAGNGDRGSITAFYTVLVEGDDFNEPITDAVRGTLDGHIVLSRELAMAGHYPAVDVLASVSRLMPALAAPEHQAAARRVRTWLAAYRAARDVLDIGAYASGSNPDVDEALRRMPAIEDFTAQEASAPSAFDDTLRRLEEIAA